MRQERKPKKAMGAFMRTMVLGIFALWLACSAFLTWREADNIRIRTNDIAKGYFSMGSFGYGWHGGTDVASKTHSWFTQTSDPVVYSQLVTDSHFHHQSMAESRGLFFQPYVILRDAEGTVITGSCDFVFGPVGIGTDAPYLAAVLDRDYFLTDSNGTPLFPNDYSVFWSGLRITGHWGEHFFQVLEMDYAEDGWHPLYRAPNADLTNAESVILSTFKLIEYPYGAPFTCQGITYPNFASYVEENPDEYVFLQENSLLETVEISGQEFIAENGQQYQLTTFIRTWPLCSAVKHLKWFYVISFTLAAAIAVWLHRLLKRKLIIPIQEIGYRMNTGWALPPFDLATKKWYAEAALLAEQYNQHQYDLYHNENEITRLNKALDYAKEAEENRRQMTSAIAHELKTPLAVIHSYTEGLQERINEEKREQYLSVIQSEVDRMDEMVLEMLDLSRLEAGKVKLAQDQFRLSKLIEATFDRLMLAVEAKELKILYSFQSEGQVMADEARIGQVLTNFITNAIKYSPHGGEIRVTLESTGRGHRFLIENEGAPLSKEALSRVWDTFYREDGTRSGEGTGLGLAIAKSIIELHGGSCGVRNTLTGVEFRFTI